MVRFDRRRRRSPLSLSFCNATIKTDIVCRARRTALSKYVGHMFAASIDQFRFHIAATGSPVADADWRVVAAQLEAVSARRGDVLLDSATVTKHMLFVSRGIAASQQIDADGDTHIARFFENRQLCTNITSAWQQSVSSDQLIAVTEFEGVRVPFAMYRDEFLSGGPLAAYWREMTLQTLLFDKDLMCVKTMRHVEARYRFLAERYERVVTDVPDKHLARFIGITPQGLSRFLKNRRTRLTEVNADPGPERL